MVFPADPLDIDVELFIDGAWEEVTNLRPTYQCWALGVKQDGAIRITQNTERSEANIARLNFTLDYWDPDAILDNDNPYSPYYQKIGQYTPIRVTVDGDLAVVGEIADTSVAFGTPARAIATLAISATGIINRLATRLSQPLRSVAYRTLTAAENDADRILYIPLEEQKSATQLDMTWAVGTVADYDTGVKFGNYTDVVVSERLATLTSDAQFRIKPPAYSATSHKLIFTMRYPETDLPSGTDLVRLEFVGGTTGKVDIRNNVLFDGEDFQIRGTNFDGSYATQTTTASFGGSVYGEELMMCLELTQNGADVDVTFFVIGPNSEPGVNFLSDSLTGLTLGTVSRIIFGAEPSNDFSFGQIAFSSNTGAFPNYISPVNGALGTQAFKGELAGYRIARLSDEEGVPYQIDGNEADTTATGVQRALPFMELIKDSVEADGGILYDNPYAVEYIYRTRRSLYTNVSVATFSYATDLAGQLTPERRSSNLTNDVTVKRIDGGEARYVIPDDDFFHWTTQPPPVGMNPIPTKPDINLLADSQNIHHAAWIAHLASWKEKSYGSIRMLLQRTTDTDLQTLVRGTVVGDNITVTTVDSSAWLPSDEIRQRVFDRIRNISQFHDEFIFTTVPADPWELAAVNTSGCVLASAIDDNDTTLVLDTTLGRGWSTADEPYYIQIGGEVMKVTAMVDDTPALVGTATAPTSGNNATLTGLTYPTGANVAGVLTCVLAAIRNSGTGTVDLPSEWTSIVNFGNLRLMGKRFVTGDTLPNITFTGGVANATTGAIVFSFSGLSMSIASGTKAAPSAATQLNGSAQDVAFPSNVVHRTAVELLGIWKQDDNSATGIPSGYTDTLSTSTTTGDDQSLAVRHDLTGATHTAGTNTMTGGASAISRAIAVALRATQTATVERGINNVAIAHAAGDAVRGWRMGVTGL